MMALRARIWLRFKRTRQTCCQGGQTQVFCWLGNLARLQELLPGYLYALLLPTPSLTALLKSLPNLTDQGAS